MNVRSRLSLLLSASLLIGSAHAEMTEALFSAFTRCDAGFFKELKSSPLPSLRSEVLQSTGDLAWIKVPNRQESSTAHVDFPLTIKVAGLPVLQYVDSVIDLEAQGLYFTWGFVIGAPLEQTYKALGALVNEGSRLKRGNPEYVRADVKVGNSSWLPIGTPVSQAVGLQKTERVFLIEPRDANTTEVTCSIQGSVTPKILQELRPDIHGREYPKAMRPVGLDDIPIPSQTKKLVDVIFKAHPKWQPRFKRIDLKQEWGDASNKKFGRLEIQASSEGFLKIKESSSSEFYVERLMALGGLIQLKHKFDNTQRPMNGITSLQELRWSENQAGAGSIAITTTSVLYLGLKMMSYAPPEPSGEICIPGPSRPASTLDSSLEGDLSILDCVDSNGQFKRELTLIEPLGLMLLTKYESITKKTSEKYTYSVLSLER